MRKAQFPFEEFQRQDFSSRRVGESTLEFVNRHASTLAAEIRRITNMEFSELPEGQAKSAIRGAMNSMKAHSFEERSFELSTLHYLKRVGCKIDAIEPTVNNGKTPDYLVSKGSQTFYVEVVSAREISHQESELERLERCLSGLMSYDVTAAVHVAKFSKNKLDVELARKQLEPAFRSYQSRSEHPVVVENSGWELKFWLNKPKKKAPYLFGGRSTSGRIIKFGNKLRASIKEKAKKYGELAYPLIVVVNATGDCFNPLEHAIEAMYGGEEFHTIDLSHLSPEFLRERSVLGNGVCQTSSRSANLHSVICFEDALVQPELTHPLHLNNPFYAGPAFSPFEGETSVRVRGTRIEGLQGRQPLVGDRYAWFQQFVVSAHEGG